MVIAWWKCSKCGESRGQYLVESGSATELKAAWCCRNPMSVAIAVSKRQGYDLEQLKAKMAVAVNDERKNQHGAFSV